MNLFASSLVVLVAVLVGCDATCSPMCENGGTCVTGLFGSTCQCPSDFYGAQCQHRFSSGGAACNINNDCLNGGTCVNHNCVCKPGFGGTNCDVAHLCSPTNATSNGTCLNGGTCSDGVCLCPPGFTGTKCENSTSGPPVPSHCLLKCANGGTCVGSRCVCRPGFSGTYCSIDNTPCKYSCQHGGQCFKTMNGTGICYCRHGYAGPYCNSTRTTPCASIRCGPNSSCHVINNQRGMCLCKPGYSGTTCQNRTTTCQPSCTNGGKCAITSYGASCICPRGFTGKYCQNNSTYVCNTNAVYQCAQRQLSNSTRRYHNKKCEIGQIYTGCAKDYGCGNLLDLWCKTLFTNDSKCDNSVCKNNVPQKCDVDQYKQCSTTVLRTNYTTVCEEQLAYAECAVDAACKTYRKYHCDISLVDCPSGKVNATLCPSVVGKPVDESLYSADEYMPTYVEHDMHFLGDEIDTMQFMNKVADEVMDEE